MATSVENQARILADITKPGGVADTDEWDDWVEENDQVLGLAVAVAAGWATLTEEGQQLLEETWASLLTELGFVVDEGYASASELLYEWAEDGP